MLWWRKWKNEIRVRTLGGMILTENFRSTKTYISGYYFVHHRSYMVWAEVRPVQEGWLAYLKVYYPQQMQKDVDWPTDES